MTDVEAEAAAADAADPLAVFRSRFHLPLAADGRPAIYLCGHSLGPMPVDAAARVEEVLAQWAALAVRGHHEGAVPWLEFHRRFAAPLAALVGARPAEVVAMNTLTVNLHLLLVSFYRPTPTRFRILIERDAFPSDRHALVSHLRYHGRASAAALVEVGPRAGEALLRTADLIAAIDAAGDTLALVLLPGVQYRTGQVLDLAAITRAARAHGAATGWDLAHAIGNVPLALHDSGADFAVWCHYKYLCAGPGAVGGAYVHERHAHEHSLPRFAGWWGHEVSTRFDMGPGFVPSAGADGWQVSNPPVLSLAPLAASLALIEAAGPVRLRAKSLALTAFARRLIEARCGDRIEILTPADDAGRGCQLSLRVLDGASGQRVYAALTAAGVIGDWRAPDVVRLAPLPLYNTFGEVERATSLLAAALPKR